MRASKRKTSGVNETDAQVMEDYAGTIGALVMGRRLFDIGDVPWGDDPPWGMPVFIVTHNARETVTRQGGTTYSFVTDGPEAALEQARTAAGDKDVGLVGGANLAQQYLNAGLLDELQIHLAPCSWATASVCSRSSACGPSSNPSRSSPHRTSRI